MAKGDVPRLASVVFWWADPVVAQKLSYHQLNELKIILKFRNISFLQLCSVSDGWGVAASRSQSKGGNDAIRKLLNHRIKGVNGNYCTMMRR